MKVIRLESSLSELRTSVDWSFFYYYQMPDTFVFSPLSGPHKGWSPLLPVLFVLFHILPVILPMYLGVHPAYSLLSFFCPFVWQLLFCGFFSYMQLYPSLFAPLVITFLISLSRKFNINYMLINTFLIYSHRHLLWLHLSLLLPLLIGVSCLL